MGRQFNWVNVNYTDLRLPPKCCDCTHPTKEHLPFTGGFNFVIVSIKLKIPFFVCSDCRKKYIHRKWLVRSIGLSIGVLVGTILAIITPAPDISVRFGMGLLVASAGMLVGWALVPRFSQPVRLARHKAASGTVAVGFPNADYAREVAEYNRTKSSQEINSVAGRRSFFDI